MLQETNTGLWSYLLNFCVLCNVMYELVEIQSFLFIYFVFLIDLGLESRCTTSALTTDLSPEE